MQREPHYRLNESREARHRVGPPSPLHERKKNMKMNRKKWNELKQTVFGKGQRCRIAIGFRNSKHLTPDGLIDMTPDSRDWVADSSQDIQVLEFEDCKGEWFEPGAVIDVYVYGPDYWNAPVDYWGLLTNMTFTLSNDGCLRWDDMGQLPEH